jgi:hypothetical protein
MASVHRALRPGGQVILVDFRRIQGQSSAWVLNTSAPGRKFIMALQRIPEN